MKVGDEITYRGKRAVVSRRSYYDGEEQCVVVVEQDSHPGWYVLSASVNHLLNNGDKVE